MKELPQNQKTELYGKCWQLKACGIVGSLRLIIGYSNFVIICACIRNSSQVCNQVYKIQLYFFTSRETEVIYDAQLGWTKEVSNAESIQGHSELCQSFMGIILRKVFDSCLGPVAYSSLSFSESGMLGGIFRSRNLNQFFFLFEHLKQVWGFLGGSVR